MAGEAAKVEGYLATVARLEPEIHPIDASAFYASAAISLRRIADALEAVAIQQQTIILSLDNISVNLHLARKA